MTRTIIRKHSDRVPTCWHREAPAKLARPVGSATSERRALSRPKFRVKQIAVRLESLT